VGGRSGAEGLIDAILGASQVLLDSGDFSASPLPDDDPYRLTHSQFVAELYASGGIDPQQSGAGADAEDSLTRVFTPLSEAQWEALREVGTLKVRPIIFQSGTAQLTLDGKREVDRAVENLKHYPNFRVMVKGHTNRRGDPEANRELSRQRAESVTRYLSVTYGIDASRMRAVGLGGDRPLPRQPGESNRAYDYRLQRVEMFLAAEDI
jgi:outer membrane protein OmpA-like peptidoglycan-associated protein